MLTLAEITANGRARLLEKTLDKSVLEAAIAEAEQVDTSSVHAAERGKDHRALNAAKAVNEDAEATQNRDRSGSERSGGKEGRTG